MILATKENGQKILLRCQCTHDFKTDKLRHDKQETLCTNYDDDFCEKCENFGWRPDGMTDAELQRPSK